MEKIRKRLFQGLGANAFGQVASIVIQLASVPIFLEAWGVQLYGEWLILSTVPSYFTMSDIGFANAAANEMTMQVAKGNKKNALEIFQSTWFFTSTICFLLGLSLFSTLWFMPIERWLNLQQTHFEVVVTIILLTTHILVKLQGGVLDAGFRCDGNYAFGVFANNIIRLLEGLSILVVIFIGGTIVGAAFTFLGFRIIGFVCMKYSLHKHSPWIVYGIQHVKLETIKRLANPAIAFMGFPLSYALINQGLTMVIAITLEPTSVVIFSTLRTISRLAFQVMVMINSTVWPEISTAYGSGDLYLARKLHHYSCKFSIWLSGLITVFLFFSGEFILDFWTGGKLVMDFGVFYVLLVVVIANSIWLTSSVVPSATNQHQNISLCFILSTVLSIILATFLTPKIGLSGAAVSVLFSDLIMSFFVLKKSLYLLQDDFLSFLNVIVKPPSFRAILKD